MIITNCLIKDYHNENCWTSHTNNPFWYLDDSNFRLNIDGFRTRLASSFQRSKDEFSKHYKNNYFNDVNPNFKQLPPFWIAAELTTFGDIRALYNSVNKTAFVEMHNSNKLDTLAREFGANNLGQLNNWIDLIRDVRNRCAHHSRVWNCNYREPKGVLNKLSASHKPAHQNRIYLFAALLHIMDKHLQLNIDIKKPIQDLFVKYPAAQIKSISAGFPIHWSSDAFWT